MSGPEVEIQYTRTGTDTDGDPFIEKGIYADYVVRIVLSRSDGLWSTVVNDGWPRAGFATIEEAKAYAVEVVVKNVELRLAEARRTFALFGPERIQQPPPQHPLTVWYGPMPESNGRQNWTACLRRTHPTDKWSQEFCFARSEYPDRVRYEADRMRWLIGETAERPDILAYDADAHSGYEERDYHLEKLLEALAPLANMAAVVGTGKDDSVYVGQSGHRLTFGDFRRAEAAYAPFRKGS